MLSGGMKFGINWDYRCPFARNMHEHVVAALVDGADWDVEFIPFSLTQTHIEEGDLSVWDDPSKAKDLLAVATGMVVRSRFPAAFYGFHVAMFAARHDFAKDISQWETIAEVLRSNGVDPDLVSKEIENGVVLEEFREAHERSVKEFMAFGVPTFFIGHEAAFVRVMTRPNGDGALARQTVGYILTTLTEHREFNEIKYTTISR